MALALLLLVLTAGLVEWAKRSRRDVPRRAAWNMPGLLLLATATGSGLGAGFAFQARRLLDTSGACRSLEASNGGGCGIVIGPYGDWLAIALTISLVVVGLTLLIRFLVAYGRHRSERQPVLVAVRAVLDCASWLLVELGILSGLAITGLIVAAASGGLPDATSLPSWVAPVSTVLLLTPVVVTALWLVWRVKSRRLRVFAFLALIVLIRLTAVAVLEGWHLRLMGLPVPPTTFLELAQLVTLLLPTTLVVTRFVYAGLQDRSVRRGVGILWDVGTFWPRWFHPFAPPTYSDRAVTYLTKELNRRLEDPDHRVLLAPHSQGSIIGAAAILGMAEDRTSRVALLTHGSPWSRYYAEFCPAVFSPDCLEALRGRLQDGADEKAVRWRDLYRTTDPIGGAIGGPIPVQGVDVEPLVDVDARTRVHESYDREDAYKQAVRELRRVLCEQQAPGQQQPEHQDEAGGAGEGGQKRSALDGAGQQPTRAHRSGQGGERQERRR